MSITKEDLKKHGFRYHRTPTLSVNVENVKYWVGLWQKEVEVEGTDDTYFVNIEEWDLSDLARSVMIGRAFDPNVQFRGDDDLPGMNVHMLTKNSHTVEDVLEYFENVRTRMGYLMPSVPAPVA